MSRIGRLPITLPEKVTADITEENVIVVTGPLGSLRLVVDKNIGIEKTTEDNKTVLTITRPNDQKENRAKHGLYRALIANMVKGVTEGFSKTLIVNGVGFKCSVSGNKLTLNLGFSHLNTVEIPNDLKVSCPTATEIKIEGCDKTKVGQFAADVKALRPVEPYHGYGIKYSDQFVLRKEIKKAAKKK